MIEINAKNKKTYRYDPDTQRLFCDGVYMSPTIAEPVYSGNDGNQEPVFVGVFLRDINSVITLSGNIKPVTDINQIW